MDTSDTALRGQNTTAGGRHVTWLLNWEKELEALIG
jgi:hypothetical protein